MGISVRLQLGEPVYGTRNSWHQLGSPTGGYPYWAVPPSSLQHTNLCFDYCSLGRLSCALHNNMSDFELKISTKFFIPFWWGEFQLQNEQIFIQIDPVELQIQILEDLKTFHYFLLMFALRFVLNVWNFYIYIKLLCPFNYSARLTVINKWIIGSTNSNKRERKGDPG